MDSPGMSDSLAQAAEAIIQTGRRYVTTLTAMSREVHALDASGIVSQQHDSDRPAQRVVDPRTQTWRSGLSSRAARARTDPTLRQITANGLDNHQTHQAHAVDRTNSVDLGASITGTETFMESLPVLSLTDLPEDSQNCPICIEGYENAQHSENPVRLPCNHIIGKDCLLNWLKSSELNANNNTCPMCRAVLFERDVLTVEDELQGLQDLLDEIPERNRARFADVREIVNQIRVDEGHDERMLEQIDQARAALREMVANLDEAARAQRLELEETLRERAELERMRAEGQ